MEVPFLWDYLLSLDENCKRPFAKEWHSNENHFGISNKKVDKTLGIYSYNMLEYMLKEKGFEMSFTWKYSNSQGKL